MIRDNEVIMTSDVGLDLETVRPGPGEPIKMFHIGGPADTDFVVTHGVDQATAEGGSVSFMTYKTDSDGQCEFELPSSVQRWIAVTFGQGSLQVSLAGNQTSK